MKAFIISLLVKALSDPRVQEALKKLLTNLIEDVVMPLVKKVLALIPAAVGASVKASVDQIVEKIPGLEGTVDIVKATDDARNSLNDLIPDIDTGIAALDQFLDAWRPKG